MYYRYEIKYLLARASMRWLTLWIRSCDLADPRIETNVRLVISLLSIPVFASFVPSFTKLSSLSSNAFCTASKFKKLIRFSSPCRTENKTAGGRDGEAKSSDRYFLMRLISWCSLKLYPMNWWSISLNEQKVLVLN